jgi:hypothetical protein
VSRIIRNRNSARPQDSLPQGLTALVSAVVVGGPLTAFAVSAALAAFLGGDEHWSFAIGYHAFTPLCVGLCCVLPLSRSGSRAWLYCLSAIVPLVAVLAVRRLV